MTRHNRAGSAEFSVAIREIPYYDWLYAIERLHVLMDEMREQGIAYTDRRRRRRELGLA